MSNTTKSLGSHVQTLARPPRELLGLVRWAALLVALFLGVRLGANFLSIGAASVAGGLALVWLGWRWARGYPLADFSPVSCFSEGVALLVLGAALDDPLDALSLVYVAVAFRSLYGRAPRALGVAVIYLTAQLGSRLTAGR